MKKTKVIILSFFLMLGTATVFGQDQKQVEDVKTMPSKDMRARQSPVQIRAYKSAQIAKELGLTEEQTAKIDAIKQKHRTEIEAKRKEIHALRMEERKQIMDVLTPEQREKMEEMRKKHSQHPPKARKMQEER